MSADRTLVVGAGVAGLATALRLAPLPVTLLTGAPLGEGTATAWAQGGIAAAIGPDDDPALHAADTRAAGAGLTDPDVAQRVAEAGPGLVAWLSALGLAFDRGPDGALALGLEAAHGRRRIVKAGGDATGRAVLQTLARASAASPSISVVVGQATALAQDANGRVAGLRACVNGASVDLPGRAVVLATGGLGGLYRATTNPAGALGSGLALAARAGAVLRDVEFVQFHPTAIATGDAGPLPLATEALRGEGAILVNAAGERVMAGIAGAELAPRDVVARAIFSRTSRGEAVFLDARRLDVARRFPTVAALCRKAGIDPAATPIPVSPAAHYHMGGIRVDGSGRTSLPGLWACGEVASTGLHGANRLASNSLLEAMAFAAFIAADIRGLSSSAGRAAAEDAPVPRPAALPEIRRIMEAEVGLVRNEAGLARAVARLGALAEAGSPEAAIGLLVAASALSRRESRGAHWREDHPGQQEPRHAEITLAQARRLSASLAPLEVP
ncbi:L-aspartate oxidase [Methylobacterium nodulans]|uniref:L-aspartate oxidase n=1 Tax=Methylobacterium nodulans (strain LMG 21967 / CNCM I-2342 / ORS 2060) TaxID=460265 RepID=B8IUH0_METNO|nr:L-aspartate oxidase [Methylobacterium nodulans]ACL55215.1 fumarate reductase/succinate dehydrogenase flavoprotein domain protein [Methylobacterium nodulans ORS 2060]